MSQTGPDRTTEGKELHMARRIPKPGEIYRHFKGKRYKILYIATCTETGEDMVIFESVEGEHKVYASELDAFLTSLDPRRYPQEEQKYRFELCRDLKDNSGLRLKHYGNTTEMILEFLDLDSNEERIKFLQSHQSEIDARFLTAAAESMEFAETGESVEERYASFIRFLKMKMKYESRRQN